MLNIVEKVAPGKSRSVVSSVDLITPDAARHLRDTAHFDRQRKISDANVTRLATEMASGRFTPGTQVYLCVLPDGSELIVNGNHTLEAVEKSGVPQVLTITRKPVRDADEAGRIYAVFDIQKIRTWRDSLRATGQADDLPLATHVLSAIGVIESKFAHVTSALASRLDRISRLEDYREAAELMAMALDGAPRNSAGMVKRAAVMAVALETFRYQPSFATEFWTGVARDDGLRVGRPERALLQWLRNCRGSGGQIAQREHCRAAALAWNAAFKGEERQYVKPNAMASFFLLGTPWSGGFGAGTGA